MDKDKNVIDNHNSREKKNDSSQGDEEVASRHGDNRLEKLDEFHELEAHSDYNLVLKRTLG